MLRKTCHKQLLGAVIFLKNMQSILLAHKIRLKNVIGGTIYLHSRYFCSGIILNP